MRSTFNIWETNRKLLSEYFDKYSPEQLNEIPKGFSNNLIWNLGHIIVAQQVLVYKSSGLEGYISDELLNLYKPGTKPTKETSENEVKELKELLVSHIEKTKSDMANGKFKIYKGRTTSMGFYLGSLKEAIEYNNYHEGLHLGYMMNIQKFV